MPLLVYLSFLCALGATCLGNSTTPQPVTTEEDPEQCSTCEFRHQSKLMRLHTIKSQILSILRLEQAPNISRDMIKQLLPKAPPLQELLSQYDLQLEDKEVATADDGELATTETIITMATERKFYALGIYPSLTDCMGFVVYLLLYIHWALIARRKQRDASINWPLFVVCTGAAYVRKSEGEIWMCVKDLPSSSHNYKAVCGCICYPLSEPRLHFFLLF